MNVVMEETDHKWNSDITTALEGIKSISIWSIYPLGYKLQNVHSIFTPSLGEIMECMVGKNGMARKCYLISFNRGTHAYLKFIKHVTL